MPVIVLCDQDVTTSVRPAIAQHGLEIRVAVIDRPFDRPCRSNLTYEESIAESREAGSKKDALRPAWADFYERNGMPEHAARMREPPPRRSARDETIEARRDLIAQTPAHGRLEVTVT